MPQFALEASLFCKKCSRTVKYGQQIGRRENLARDSLFGEVVGSQQRIPDSRPGIPTLDEA